jgi:hypothetical protein
MAVRGADKRWTLLFDDVELEQERLRLALRSASWFAPRRMRGSIDCRIDAGLRCCVQESELWLGFVR